MIQLILGGARSGKSRLAEQIAQQLGKSVIYVASGRCRNAGTNSASSTTASADLEVVRRAFVFGAAVKDAGSSECCDFSGLPNLVDE